MAPLQKTKVRQSVECKLTEYCGLKGIREGVMKLKVMGTLLKLICHQS